VIAQQVPTSAPAFIWKARTMHDSINLHKALLSLIRFNIVLQLEREGGTATFRDVQRQQITNDSAAALTHHLEILERDGLARRRKEIDGHKVRTFIDITAAGRKRFADHVAALKAIAA
jgi:DNA-binding MarR family transcriptional regulator